MNLALNIFYSLVFGFAHIGQVLCGPCSKPALKDIRENSYYNVKVFEHPNKSMFTDFCRETWRNSGTCCDGKDAL